MPAALAPAQRAALPPAGRQPSVALRQAQPGTVPACACRREVWPDPDAPGGVKGAGEGGVEFQFTGWTMSNITQGGLAVSEWSGAGTQSYLMYKQLCSRIVEIGERRGRGVHGCGLALLGC